MRAYLSLEVADEQAVQDLAGLVAVADVLEGFGGVLAADVQQDFLAASVVRMLVCDRPECPKCRVLSAQGRAGRGALRLT